MDKFTLKHLKMKKFTEILIVLVVLVSCNGAEKQIPPPEIYLSQPDGGYEMELTDTLTIEPRITYDYGSAYAWTENGLVVSNEKNLEFIPTQMEQRTFSFKVTNPQGEAEIEVGIDVISLGNLQSFGLKDNASQLSALPANSFVEKNVVLPNQPLATPRTWNGFALSTRTQTTAIDSSAILSVNAGKGSGSQANAFAIYHYRARPSDRMSFRDNAGHTIKSIDVCNSAFTALTAKFGYAAAGIDKFEMNDYLLLHITGYDATGNPVETTPVVLVDYRFANPAKYEILSSWKTINLKNWNQVWSIDFALESNRHNVPQYVCIDNIKLTN